MLRTPFFSIAALLVALLAMSPRTDGNKTDETESRLETLSREYDDALLRSFYSMDELRPYSIIQLDKTIEMYQNEWISPKEIVAALSEDEKRALLKSVVEYLRSFDSETRKKIFMKTEYWCKAERQLLFLVETMDFEPEHISAAISRLDEGKNILSRIAQSGESDSLKLSERQKDEYYYKTINFVSGLQKSSQMLFFSKVYERLAFIAKR